MRLAKVVAFSLVVLLSIFGCGGSNGGGLSNPFEGVYRTTFTRGAGAPDTGILVIVQNDGSTWVAISDNTHILYSGEGKTTFLGDLSVVASDGTTNVQVSGDCNGSSIGLDLSGGISSNVSVTRLASASGTLFGTPYFGSFTGSFSGTFTFAVDANRVITGTVHIPAELDFPVTGTLGEFGQVVFSGSGYQFDGDVFIGSQGSVLASGAWVGPGAIHGSWAAGLD